MKKVLLSVVLFLFAIVAYAQNLEEFYMPIELKKGDRAKFIGKRVCVFDYSSYDNTNRKLDSDKFDRYDRFHYERIYTIKKIQFKRKRIIVRLVSEEDRNYKILVSKNKKPRWKELSSCNVFFLWDDFEAEKKNLLGKVYKNSNNEEVAVLENIELIPRRGDNPALIYTLRSKINNEEFVCLAQNAEALCSRIGTVISNPKVKDEYKVLSGFSRKAEDDYINGMYKCSYAEQPWYTYQNIRTGVTSVCLAENILTTPFIEDLSGKYVSTLVEVEKPANPEIRYGETTTVLMEDDISKFLYKDNIISIMIFADKSGFNFVLHNISENSIKVIWDEAVFVNFDGNIEKVIHKGVDLSKNNSSQPATTIIKNAKLEDLVIPTHLIYYREPIHDIVEGGWDTHSMYPEEKEKALGQIKLMLPIQIKDVINEYVFVFDVEYKFNHPDRINLGN